MISILKRLRRRDRQADYQLPQGLRVYAVGDVHGRADLLSQLHSMIIQDAGSNPGQQMQVVYLGDYLDRGPYVRQTLDELLSGLPSSFGADYLMGNHERLFMAALEDPSLMELWLELGGQTTLLSYGVQAPGSGFSMQRAQEVQEALLEAIPQDHLNFIKNLRQFLHIGDFLFVHAGIIPGKPLAAQTEDELLWIRDEFLSCGKDFGVKVVHGHTVSESVQEFHNRIGIDTGAYATGVLTCAVIEGAQVRYLSTASTGKQ